MALFARAESLAVASGDQELIRNLQCEIGDALLDADQTDSARVLVNGALQQLSRQRNPDRRAVASCLHVQAQLYEASDSIDAAVRVARQGLAQLDTAGAIITLQGAVALNSLATYLERSDGRGAARMYDSASAVMDSIGYSETLAAIGILSNSYSALIKLGNIKQGLAVTREATRRIELANPGTTHPIVSFQYAQALFNAAQYDSSVVWYQKMITAANAAGLKEPARRGWIGLTRAATRVGDLALARRAFDSVQVMNRAMKRPFTRDSLFMMASIQMAQKSYPEALATWKAVLQADGYPGKKIEASRPPLLEGSLAALLVGQPDTALALAKGAEDIVAMDSLGRVESAYFGEAEMREAKALAALGQKDEARSLIDKAIVALVTGAGEEHPKTVEARAFQKELASP